jgi:hypothetical protein
VAKSRRRPKASALAALTASEEVFVSEYLIDANGTRAYKVAFPDAAYTTCRTNASGLLAKANIAAEVRARREARQKRTQVTADAAVIEASRLAFSDPLYLFEDDGVTPRNIRTIPIETRRAIASVKVRRERQTRKTFKDGTAEVTVTVVCELVEYKLWPKSHGLDKVFKHLGLEQEIPPLENVLALLPRELAAQVRAALAGALSAAGAGPSG